MNEAIASLTDEDFKYKIINASPTRLVIVTYELVLNRMYKAMNFLDAGDEHNFRKAIENAKAIMTEMITNVNASNDVARQLIGLYFFVNKALTQAYFKKNASFIVDAEEVINRLMLSLNNEVDDNMVKDNPKRYTDNSGIYSALGSNKFESY